jgi:hypothetical protein
MAEITFFNMWEASSREDQEALIAEMRIEAPSLAAKDGFVSLAVWNGEKGDYRVLAEGRWASQAHFDAAVADNAHALQARSRLEKFAKPAPGLFTECFRLEGKPNEASHLDQLLKNASDRCTSDRNHGDWPNAGSRRGQAWWLRSAAPAKR